MGAVSDFGGIHASQSYINPKRRSEEFMNAIFLHDEAIGMGLAVNIPDGTSIFDAMKTALANYREATKNSALIRPLSFRCDRRARHDMDVEALKDDNILINVGQVDLGAWQDMYLGVPIIVIDDDCGFDSKGRSFETYKGTQHFV